MCSLYQVPKVRGNRLDSSVPELRALENQVLVYYYDVVANDKSFLRDLYSESANA